MIFYATGVCIHIDAPMGGEFYTQKPKNMHAQIHSVVLAVPLWQHGTLYLEKPLLFTQERVSTSSGQESGRFVTSFIQTLQNGKPAVRWCFFMMY